MVWYTTFAGKSKKGNQIKSRRVYLDPNIRKTCNHFPCLPRPRADLLTIFASACFALARLALHKDIVGSQDSIKLMEWTYSSATSFSKILTWFRASVTIALAWDNALSASFSASSASVTFWRAAWMVGSLCGPSLSPNNLLPPLLRLPLRPPSESSDDDDRRPKKPPRVDVVRFV